jgi:hypothetical protein
MDRAMIEGHLALAERHIMEGEQRVARQQKLVDRLEHDGHDVGDARALLAQFLELQALFIADRDRLRAELASL